MKQLFLGFILSATCFSVLNAQEGSNSVFPDDFFGIYSGTLKISSRNGNQELPMEFHLQPTDTLGKYSYKLIYIPEGNRMERAYHLIEQNKEAGEYIVDENNGIILDDKVVDQKMYAIFEVNDALLTTFITFEADHVLFEIVAANTTQKRTTYAENEEGTEVISYPVSTVQRAVLQKQ